MKFVECELHSPTKMSKLIGLASLESPLHIVSTLYRVYMLYACIGQIIMLTRA